MSLLVVMLDGELRLYEAEGRDVEEWGRVVFTRTGDHETLARVALDLAALARPNGAVPAVEHHHPAPAELPPVRPVAEKYDAPDFAPKPLARRGATNGPIHDALVELGPKTTGELAAHLHWTTKRVSMAASALRGAGYLRRSIDGRWSVVMVPSGTKPKRSTAKRGRPSGSGDTVPWQRLVVELLMGYPEGLELSEIRADLKARHIHPDPRIITARTREFLRRAVLRGDVIREGDFYRLAASSTAEHGQAADGVESEARVWVEALDPETGARLETRTISDTPPL